MTSSPPARLGNRITPLLLATLGTGAVVAGCYADVGALSRTAGPPAGSPFLSEVAGQIGLPERTLTASGTHTAKGYTTRAARTSDAAGMKADCDNINVNKKLSADFRSDVFGPGMKGFFYKCEKIAPDTNKYWFTISSANRAQIRKLCAPSTQYPIVYDAQHGTYWLDEPFTCTNRVGPA
ncbi:hypothetical protein [Streptomyces sp. TS71-3]|uniref:hypothetical protein n=1 Tax=Streptomyces sp. TS71-3 TaxID=2733862 RepID=UPI001B0D8616|nr:hypothetical protein [Streptomyces sp. TS71-3]GHJ35038.1 hypothetical protein Sm713_06470 [Streptomyces sp. TS71-3]